VGAKIAVDGVEFVAHLLRTLVRVPGVPDPLGGTSLSSQLPGAFPISPNLFSDQWRVIASAL
jgi:hypothetical protein